MWDFVEVNILSESAGGFDSGARSVFQVVERLLANSNGFSIQSNSQTQSISLNKFISTDPPYYDNIGYADLSDFFYVWLRRSLSSIFPALFATPAVPKAEELVATPYRHGGKEKAEKFFLDGMTEAMRRLAEQAHPSAPITIYYAFKQSQTKGDTSSTGWETFLEAVMRSGLSIHGTWPMRTELSNRMIGSGTNALASSIVLVCRRRLDSAKSISRREFLRELDQVLPVALDEMTKGAGEQAPVAPVDLSQSIIGPGMAVFSKYRAVLEADGKAMGVKTALQLINRFLADSDFDPETNFCLDWFDQSGWKEGAYGDADVLARAKATAVERLAASGVLSSGAGKVRLLRPAEYPVGWVPDRDTHVPVWELLHQLIRAFRADGEGGAGRVLAPVKEKTDSVRQLAYRLYTLCERRSRAEEARDYNDIVTAWASVETASYEQPEQKGQQRLFGRD